MAVPQAVRAPRAISAARLPPIILTAIFAYLDLKDIASCMRVCRHWWTVLEYEVGIFS